MTIDCVLTQTIYGLVLQKRILLIWFLKIEILGLLNQELIAVVDMSSLLLVLEMALRKMENHIELAQNVLGYLIEKDLATNNITLRR